MFDDLRSFLEAVQKNGECEIVEGADCEVDIGGISGLKSEIPNSPLMMFDKIAGYPEGYRVVSNVFSSPKRIALALGLPAELKGANLVKALKERIKAGIDMIPPVEVDNGPVLENVLTGDDVNIFNFPTPIWNEGDGGRYIGTGSVTIMKDPDEGWVNVGTYRVQVHDEKTVTVTAAPGHHGRIIAQKYWDKGESCPTAITCGQEPLLFCASAWEGVPWGVSEYDLAGGLKNKPVEVVKGVTTDLPIPATAEIVLEGDFVSPEVETRMEGPFGENTGYYLGDERPQPVMKVRSILHRNDPIIQGNPPSRFPEVWTLGRHFQKAASLWNELDRNMPGICGVRMVEDASIHSIVVISLKQQYEGHAKQAAYLAAGCSATRNLRYIIVVDDDIDPFETSQVLWALGTRSDPATSIDILAGMYGPPTEPMRSPEQTRFGKTDMSLGIIIACKPFYRIKDFAPSIKISPEREAMIREKWSKLF